MSTLTGPQPSRRRAQWEIGDPSWADMLIDAYFSPDGTDVAVLTQEAAR